MPFVRKTDSQGSQPPTGTRKLILKAPSSNPAQSPERHVRPPWHRLP